MIFSIRSAERAHFKGFNIFVLRDWFLPVESLPSGCFMSFDEAITKLKVDTEATRIFAIESKSTLIANLNTATEAALRSLPERWRASAELYSLALSGRKISFRLPHWAYLFVEDKQGDFSQLQQNPTEKSRWVEFELNPDDRFLHLTLFKDRAPLHSLSHSEEEFSSFRAAKLIDRASYRHLNPSFSLALGEET